MIKKTIVSTLLILSLSFLNINLVYADDPQEGVVQQVETESSSSSSSTRTDSFDVFEVFSISEDPNDSISGSTSISDNIKKYAEEHTDGNIASAIILRAINVLLLLIGTFAFLVIFYSGILLVTANGDEGKLEKGKTMIVPAILGLVVAFLAYYITVFVQSFFY